VHHVKTAPNSASPASSVPPLLIDIREASRQLGITVFAVRNLCWHSQTARLLKPIRHGKKYLFSPAVVTEFAAKLVRGEASFPPVAKPTPTERATKAKARRRSGVAA